MIYQYDQALQLPTVDLYDTQIMAMALNAAKDMYEKGEQQIKDFQKAYGDFLTPIAADQDWWNQNVTGRVKDAINQIYARGGDPLRNAQDRAQLSMLINNMPYGDMAKKKERAKNAEEYYKNMAALRLNDKYNEDFSKFLGEDPSQWADDFMGTTSPTAFKTLKDATNDWYNNRTARMLNPNEVPGYDKRYDYTGFLDSDLMNVARGNTPGWQGSAISEYYRDIARRELQELGINNPTKNQIEQRLQRNIANAQQEWLIAPIKNENKYELQQQSFRNQLALQKDSQQFQKEMAEQAARDKLDQIRARYGAKGINGGKDNPENQNYSLTESIHHDLLFQGIRNSGIPVVKLTTDDKGNVIPAKDKNGKFIYINPDQASWNELEYAANNNNNYVYNQQKFFENNSIKYPSSPEKVERLMKQRYGSRITGIQLASMLKRQIQKDGSIILSSGEAKLLRGTKGITGDAIGSKYNLNYNERLAELYNKINNAISSGDDSDKIVGEAQIKFNLTDTGNNAVQISEKYNKGRTEIYANGTITVTGKNKEGKPISKEITTDAWLPLGLNSETVAGKGSVRISNVALASNNQSAYSSIDANYMKAMGQQQKSNIGLWANSEMPMMIDPNNIDIEDLYELMQNNQ